ncbi:MAG: CTAG/PCC1 family protein [Candidatus Micrarchaeaceae archaeon]
MPRSVLNIELDNPKDYFEILMGERFKGGAVNMKVEGNRLKADIEAVDPKTLIAITGSVIKQIRIIEQTEDLIKGPKA